MAKSKEAVEKPLNHLSWEDWKDQVFQIMLNDYPQIFGATDTQPQITRTEVDWELWRPWYNEGLSAKDAIEKSLVSD